MIDQQPKHIATINGVDTDLSPLSRESREELLKSYGLAQRDFEHNMRSVRERAAAEPKQEADKGSRFTGSPSSLED